MSERFVPDQDRGRLIEAEHLARYLWAAQLASGRRVLDAGCGTAYGSRLLAEAGASEVVGVDLAEPVLDAVREQMPSGVTLERADLRELPFPAGGFDLVVCFEVIEHLADPFPVLDELVRMLGAGGVLLISSPNRDVYPQDNPHHLHEFESSELESTLRERLAHVQLVRQNDYIGSAILDDATHEQGDGTPLSGLDVRKLVAGEAGRELYTIAVAGDGELPELEPLVTFTGILELREWLAASQTQTDGILARDHTIAELRERLAEHDAIARQLLEAEQRLAGLPDLHARIEDLEHELREAHRGAEAARERARELDDGLMRARRTLVEVMSSPSWKLTRPLRVAKRLLRG